MEHFCNAFDHKICDFTTQFTVYTSIRMLGFPTVYKLGLQGNWYVTATTTMFGYFCDIKLVGQHKSKEHISIDFSAK